MVSNTASRQRSSRLCGRFGPSSDNEYAGCPDCCIGVVARVAARGVAFRLHIGGFEKAARRVGSKSDNCPHSPLWRSPVDGIAGGDGWLLWAAGIPWRWGLVPV